MTNNYLEPTLIETPFYKDDRGSFAKPFPLLADSNLEFAVREIFWSTSAKGVIRGMHFQVEPDAITKIVWVSTGSVFDVLVDLREGNTFGDVSTFTLSASNGNSLVVPRGFAHGFQSLEESSVVSYAVDGPFSPTADRGVRWDSIGVSWPLPPSQISTRDREHPFLADFAPRFSRI
jgi:dTDP-4-dehydrorhamnose 3,5-epimerase